MRLGSRIIYVQYAYCRKVKKSFVKNLGMSEWAPLPACRSSATPLPLPMRYPYAYGGDVAACITK